MASKNRVLIINSAKGTTNCYKKLLGNDFVCTVCTTGKEAKKVIKSGKKFDLVITELALPVEDMRLSLNDAWSTGIRLIRMMLDKGTCNRFYVCTSQKSFQGEVMDLCSGKALLHFEYILDNEPEEFHAKVSELIRKPIPLCILMVAVLLNIISWKIF